jgi:aminopeptidase N
MKRKYKYMGGDFRELPARLTHMTIYLNFLEDRVETRNSMELSANRRIAVLPLDANGLKIIRVESCGGKELPYRYDQKRNKLLVRMERPVRKGERICVRTFTHCSPSHHVLKGIYRDTTPPGAPQQYMSQCEMWGFQRIMPVLDDPRSKCTITTTLEGDARYTHLIGTGNISRETNPEGVPVQKPGDPSRKVITYENNIPISPYLFIAAAGTWDVLRDSVTYPNGRKINLEYLVPPGRANDARIPMEILKKAILWTRERQGYEYPWETYRTITMNKSDSGGMENAGNTTIVTDAALIDEHTLDGFLLYAYSVISHEFEHNQCGSSVTMETPFDMWLNEAYTVDVERQFSAEHFNPAMLRSNHVAGLRDPVLGPLAVEDAGYKGRVVRRGFNDPDELIDGVTYEKAPEIIRMLRLMLGGSFRKGKEIYFSRYRSSNANTEQFFKCFEEAWGRSLSRFRRGWLLRRGYPTVTASTSYDERKKEYRIRFSQKSGGEPFHIPVELALVDEKGRDIPGTSQVFSFSGRKAELVIRNVNHRPAFASLNRDFSFYGMFKQDMTREEMIKQALMDPNQYNRAEAMRKLTDVQRVKLLKNPRARIDRWWLELYGKILEDRSIPPSLKAVLLSIDEISYDRKYIGWFRERAEAREALMRAVNREHREKLVSLFSSLNTYVKGPLEKGIEDRMLKAVLLGLIAVEDSPESHEIILGHYRGATTATDRVSGLLALNRSKFRGRRKVLDEVYRKWHSHISGYPNYLRIIGSGKGEHAWKEVEVEKNRESMDLKNPTLARALVMSMAFNTRMAWTDRGMEWVRDNVIEFSKINTTLATRLLNTFQLVNRMRPEVRRKVLKHLRIIEKKCRGNPAVLGQARAYLGK